MYTFSHLHFSCRARPFWRAWLCLGAGLILPSLATAAQVKKNPTSKIYVADVDGEAEIDTGDRVDDLTKKSVYSAQGAVIETKEKAVDAMVFSNGTGIFFDEETRVEVKRFDQEPFLPNRSDMDVEPSISQTQAYLPRGTVGICPSKLVAGSSMVYNTPLGGVNIRGGKVVIEARDGLTKISMLQGESTVGSGGVNTGGQALKDGMQAVIRRSPGGGRPRITIQPIPSAERRALEGKLTMACTAKKTVYFAAENPVNFGATNQSRGLANPPTGRADGGEGGPGPEGDSIFSAPASSAGAGAPGGAGSVSAFDGDSANSTGGATVSTSLPVQNIVAVPVLPNDLPVEFTVSPANLTSTTPAP